jgi:hypothetical protein
MPLVISLPKVSLQPLVAVAGSLAIEPSNENCLACLCKSCVGPRLFCRCCLNEDTKNFSMSPLPLKTDKCNLLELKLPVRIRQCIRHVVLNMRLYTYVYVLL